MAFKVDRYTYSEETYLENVKYDTKHFSEEKLDRYQHRLLEYSKVFDNLYVIYCKIFYYKVSSSHNYKIDFTKGILILSLDSLQSWVRVYQKYLHINYRRKERNHTICYAGKT